MHRISGHRSFEQVNNVEPIHSFAGLTLAAVSQGQHYKMILSKNKVIRSIFLYIDFASMIFFKVTFFQMCLIHSGCSVNKLIAA